MRTNLIILISVCKSTTDMNKEEVFFCPKHLFDIDNKYISISVYLPSVHVSR